MIVGVRVFVPVGVSVPVLVGTGVLVGISDVVGETTMVSVAVAMGLCEGVPDGVAVAVGFSPTVDVAVLEAPGVTDRLACPVGVGVALGRTEAVPEGAGVTGGVAISAAVMSAAATKPSPFASSWGHASPSPKMPPTMAPTNCWPPSGHGAAATLSTPTSQSRERLARARIPIRHNHSARSRHFINDKIYRS